MRWIALLIAAAASLGAYSDCCGECNYCGAKGATTACENPSQGLCLDSTATCFDPRTQELGQPICIRSCRLSDDLILPECIGGIESVPVGTSASAGSPDAGSSLDVGAGADGEASPLGTPDTSPQPALN